MLTFSIINVPRKIQASDMVLFLKMFSHFLNHCLGRHPKRHPPCLETGPSINLLYAILTFSIQRFSFGNYDGYHSFSQQWKHPTSSLFLKCLVNIFTLATTYKFVYRPCGVMVSTLDFESSDPSSSLGIFCIDTSMETLSFFFPTVETSNFIFISKMFSQHFHVSNYLQVCLPALWCNG